jgi:hypothetical protein
MPAGMYKSKDSSVPVTEDSSLSLLQESYALSHCDQLQENNAASTVAQYFQRLSDMQSMCKLIADHAGEISVSGVLSGSVQPQHERAAGLPAHPQDTP